MKKVTRESNKNLKGGELHTKYDKRPTADVQAEKAALTAEKVRKGKSRAQDEELPLKRKKTVSKVVYVEVTDDEDMESDPGHESNNDSGQILESDDSGEEFIPGENEDESDEDIEMEGEEPDTVIERKKKRKGKTAGEKKGVTARGHIRELRDGMSTCPASPVPNRFQVKRGLSKRASNSNP
ncbi:hypothetical protein EST38_g11116 [Candolleomyces aberdarensis]|uniref:Uncharacterized protein n=1 Tax=Candolleomyces aberdarensis TaxID=2316362 RepID=A0A4Q2D805_9AGAR|nr:hypothetical protein EST38_g11116 [Candolleomyces aberdarensis]